MLLFLTLLFLLLQSASSPIATQAMPVNFSPSPVQARQHDRRNLPRNVTDHVRRYLVVCLNKVFFCSFHTLTLYVIFIHRPDHSSLQEDMYSSPETTPENGAAFHLSNVSWITQRSLNSINAPVLFFSAFSHTSLTFCFAVGAHSRRCTNAIHSRGGVCFAHTTTHEPSARSRRRKPTSGAVDPPGPHTRGFRSGLWDIWLGVRPARDLWRFYNETAGL